MSSSPETRSPLAQLVLFMVCLSVAGTFVAGAHYYVIDIPEQKAIAGHPPGNANGDTIEKCNTCISYCNYVDPEVIGGCISDCDVICG